VLVIFNAGSWPVKMPLLARINYLTTNFLRTVPPVVFDWLQTVKSYTMKELASHPTACGTIEMLSRDALERSAYFDCIFCCWYHQGDISSIEKVVPISVGSKC